MAAAASAWLDALDPAERALAQVPWPSDEERHRWHYTPTDHGGLPLLDMRPAQQRRAMQLLRTGLSRAAYVTATTIMGTGERPRRARGLGRRLGSRARA
jgi:hypothetical protein